MPEQDLEHLAIAVVRGLAMDGPHAARSGHQGTAMALAPLAHVLWTRIMRYDASDPYWPDRDRFILSAGHASILLYSMLYLTGYELSLDDLRSFRQWGSVTPGHPEVGTTPGVEVTTGPLGQGLANAVGMAIAERNLRARFGPETCDHRTWVVCSDGDLEEGLSHEAASLAGHLQLGRLVAIYDDNHITIDGPTELALSDSTPARFESYGWQVLDLEDKANDTAGIEAALQDASKEERPSLVVLRSHIGSPSPDVDTAAVHGYSLKEEAVAETKRRLGLPDDQNFWVPQEVLNLYREAGRRGAADRRSWERRTDNMGKLGIEWDAIMSGSGIPGWKEHLPKWKPGQTVSTRKASNICLQAMVQEVPGIIGGGADLTGNTGTTITDCGVQDRTCPEGRQIYFGVREHAMGAIANGMALHGTHRPVIGTFLVFSDYMRGAVRLAALSRARNIFVWSHDSVGVGEDGPTHQPIEQAASLRAIPDLDVFRPADANETAGAWKAAIEADGPTALLLTRQDVPVLAGSDDDAMVACGGYILADSTGPPDVVLIATGSEVQLAIKAMQILSATGWAVRVVSMPCTDRFAAQDLQYQESILPLDVPAVSVEAGTTFGWARWADRSVGIDRFGASAPGDQVLSKLGITAEAVVAAAEDLLSVKEPNRHG